MSSFSYQNPNSNPTFDEHRWIIHIRRLLDEDDEQEPEIPVCIFNVPKALQLTSPESYVPQLVALGPYHHCRPELYEMERCKLSAAKRSQKHLQGLKFHHLVDQLTKVEPRFRACYHKYLDFNGETLAWMMAVDSCFLLEFLQAFSVKEGGTSRKRGHDDAIFRDIVMLENQVPLFSLRKTLEFFSGSDGLNELIHKIVIAFCQEVSPFKMIRELPDVNQVTKSAHLLEILYIFSTVQDFQGSLRMIVDDKAEEEERKGDEKMDFRKIISRLKTGTLSSIKRLVISKPVKFILTLPWKIISNLPGMLMMKQVEYLCFSQEKNLEKQTCEINKHPLMEEIAIPSVTELSNAGIKFSATNSGISGTSFDSKTATFHLPAVVLDLNTEVIMRNLVAFEACNASGPLIFTRYTELMNGIIDSEDDAKILREEGIVLNHLKSDEEVAKLWNGMSKCIRLTEVPFLDKVIEDVNGYYNGRWKVRIGRILKRHVFRSWQSITFLAAILLLFFMSLQTFCSVFGCVRLFFRSRRIG